MGKSKGKILFVMTGSIACYKACNVISQLVQSGHQVQVVASEAALKFVGNSTLEGLTGNPTISDMYSSGNVMEHIHLMRWADIVLVAPATANYINKISQGVGDDLITTLFLAHDFKRPFIIAPAMNSSMYLHPITQKSIASLKSMGIEFIEPSSGVLACGEQGVGRLPEPEQILNLITGKFAELIKGDESAGANNATNDNPVSSIESKDKTSSATARIKILVTAGGTQEPIDTVRVITNLSSGNTGISIAESLSQMGYEVTLLQSHSSRASISLETDLKNRDVFTSFSSLDQKMKNLLETESYTHVIHTAAVSDYSVTKIGVGDEQYEAMQIKKVSSSAEEMTIHLKRNHKIVDRIKDYSRNKNIKIIAFKLTSHASEQEKTSAINKLFESSRADIVVHNDLTDIDIKSRSHKFTVIQKDSGAVCESLVQLQNKLASIISSYSIAQEKL